MKCFIIYFALFICYSGFAQNNQEIDVYAHIDRAALLVGNTKNPESLSRELTKDYTKEQDKVRAIFRWIADNIAYDTKAYHAPQISKSFTYSSEEELRELIKEQELKDAIETLKKKRGICYDYSNLFSVMCQFAGIESMIVDGYSRQNPNTIGRKAPMDHSWNVVNVDGRWFLLDLTWAAGYTDPAVTKYTKSFNDFYFFTSPFNFMLNHYPEDPKWLLLENEFTYNDFINQVYIYSHKYLPYFSDIFPSKGYLDKGEDATINFNLSANVKEIGVQNSSMKYYETLPFNGGCCATEIKIPKQYMKGRYIDIVVDGDYFIRYLIK